MDAIVQVLNLNTTLVAQVFNFIMLLIFLRVVVYPHIVRILENRQEFIANNVAAAEEDRKQAEALRQQYLDELQKAKNEAQSIIQKAGKVAEEQAHEIIEAAKAESNRIKESALQDINREKEKAVAELRDQVATLSILVAGKIVSEKMTADIQRSMIDEFIKEAGDLPC
ncbi:ATP synthase subunit b, sodium ion specific [Sporotomaculum syntrophicum]|uniref:ATP synthase subunit b n=1 Tax=Sporotomaculum syntrophicum TaxID=182264 RepID=A0A9D3AYF4_9FIRM|nr:F0F1 ATP synthase subunit B [Sporotomaculum syntrophicum]KAF1086022.1 ATP synthase subunit b, sodium ion specific [Sporotomaculum syntrophicum]